MNQNYELDEKKLVAHNIACAVSVVAASKGLTPENDENCELDAIISNVIAAYRYAYFHVARYHKQEHVEGIIGCPQQGSWTWSPIQPGQD